VPCVLDCDSNMSAYTRYCLSIDWLLLGLFYDAASTATVIHVGSDIGVVNVMEVTVADVD
jgi:hypothetical protein